ncbi:MAG TPA: methyltransferase domain-containing protein [Longimicrobium sp.]|nr:methyltransferase domain-containing protein [Longimicrobium sp.]
MKHVVMLNEARVSEVRPPALLDRFRELSVADATRWFPPASLAEVPCPACGGRGPAAFTRFGFQYRRCAACASLYVSPRPSAAAVDEYYRESEAARFRREYLTAETPERAEMLRERALWIGRVADEVLPAPRGAFADFGTTHHRLLHEVGSLAVFGAIQSVEPAPSAHLSVVRARAQVVEPAPDSLSAAGAFELLEHQASPRALMERVHRALAPGGVLFLTSRTCDGFDITVLGERAPYIYVPEHLNLLSIEGVTRLLEATGFRILELSTPGQLDVELVLQVADADPGVALPPFVEMLLRHRPVAARDDFQQFLQRHLLSSHLRLTAVKEES